MAITDSKPVPPELQRELNIKQVQRTIPVIINYLYLLEKAFDNEDKLVVDNISDFIIDARMIVENLVEVIDNL
ncbi:hypothetical protein [Vibrio parahaemolyticus]|uniref:hypothetical protein n=1 Tax=Vibrio parahaemolyticus TaxID=670 RepID=UPI000A1EE407|nr:hypothetical protein [Vibrio parahaemolyticus]